MIHGLMIAVSAAAAFTLSSPAFATSVTGTASVIDGDTIEIHGERIRLEAIDAIEDHQRCTLPNGRAWRCGRDAAFALADRIGRSPVTCAISGRDRYSRLVATCYLGGEDLNGWMVRQGWAVAYRHYGTQYVDEENAARRERLGIWASSFEMPWDWRRGR